MLRQNLDLGIFNRQLPLVKEETKNSQPEINTTTDKLSDTEIQAKINTLINDFMNGNVSAKEAGNILLKLEISSTITVDDGITTLEFEYNGKSYTITTNAIPVEDSLKNLRNTNTGIKDDDTTATSEPATNSNDNNSLIPQTLLNVPIISKLQLEKNTVEKTGVGDNPDPNPNSESTSGEKNSPTVNPDSISERNPFPSLKPDTNSEVDKSEETKSSTETDTTSETESPEFEPTVEAIPTSQEDIEAIWTEITTSHIGMFEGLEMPYTASNFYAQVEYMLKSDNPVVKQFAQMFKDAFVSLDLNQAAGAALVDRITANLREKVVGNGSVADLLMKEPFKYYLQNLDKNQSGSIFDELDMAIQEEVSKVKKMSKAEIENATTMDIETLINPTGEEPKYIPIGAMVDDSIDTNVILRNIPDMLLCEDAGVRKFANTLTSLFSKYVAIEDSEKEKIISNLFNMIKYQSSMKAWEDSIGKPLNERTYKGVQPKAIYYTNSSFINKDELANFDLNSDGNMFDDIENIINSDEFNKRNRSMTQDFWDTDSMYEWATMYLATNSEEATATKNSLTYDELFKLASDEKWNDENENLFGKIWRNVDEIDQNKDGKISKEEMQAVVGECTASYSMGNNIRALDEARAEEYEQLTLQQRLNKVIEEAKRYCKMKGLDEQLKILNGNGGHWKVVVGGADEGAAGTCEKFNHTIHIDDEFLANRSMEEVVGTLLHEATHAVYSEFLDSIEQENYCDQIKEDYLDTVGLGQYKQEEEAEKIDYENSNHPIYKDLPHDNNFWRNVAGAIGEAASSVWNWIKGWF